MRRLAKVIKLLVLALELLALPLVYVSAFKENPAGSQDATIVARDLSWNFWYPRCVSQIVLHAFLGPHVKTHHALRWAYLAALVGFVALDSVAAVALQGVRAQLSEVDAVLYDPRRCGDDRARRLSLRHRR